MISDNSQIADANLLRPNPLLAWREIDGAVVIISPEDSVVHELNPTASFIWKQLNGKRTPNEIAQQLADEFEVTRETALADTKELVESLAGLRLLCAQDSGEGNAHV